VIFRPAGNDTAIDALTGANRGHEPIDGEATAYVCQNFMCRLPTTDIDEMLELLEREG
jgi:uncharacterized protein YyaL (SSP411 family)